MAAPNSAYRPDKIPLNLDGIDLGDTLIALVEAWMTSDALVRNTFFLDGFFSVGDGTASGTTTNHGFIGFCYVGSFNYYMHNLARISYISGWYNGQEIVIFNDAGLNTLGESIFLNFLNKRVSSFTASGIFKSSYYAISTDAGFYFRTQSFDTGLWSNWRKVAINEGALQPNETLTTSREWRLNVESKVGDNVEVRPYLINPEGEFIGDTYSAVAEADILILYYGVTKGDACLNTTSPQEFYSDVAFDLLNVGDFILWDDGTGVLKPAPTGYYRRDAAVFHMGGSQQGILSIDVCGGIDPDPSHRTGKAFYRVSFSSGADFEQIRDEGEFVVYWIDESDTWSVGTIVYLSDYGETLAPASKMVEEFVDNYVIMDDLSIIETGTF